MKNLSFDTNEKLCAIIYCTFIVLMLNTVYFDSVGLPDSRVEILYYLAIFLLEILTSLIFTVNIFKFNNVYISITYRIFYMTVLSLLFKTLLYTTFESTLTDKAPTQTVFLLSLILFAVLSLIVGIIVSLPFKLIAAMLNNIDTIYDDLDKTSSKKINNRSNNTKTLSLLTMNETELMVNLNNAIAKENYELANKIKKELEKFR